MIVTPHSNHEDQEDNLDKQDNPSIREQPQQPASPNMMTQQHHDSCSVQSALVAPALNLNATAKRRSSWRFLLSPSYKTRSDEFRKLFADEIPKGERLLADYSCALHREILIQGRLYVSINYLAFYSNIFSWVTRLVVRLSDICDIHKANTAKIIPNAIQAITRKGDKHVFASFIARDKSFLLIWRVWRDRHLIQERLSDQEIRQLVHLSYGKDSDLDDLELNHSPSSGKLSESSGGSPPDSRPLTIAEAQPALEEAQDAAQLITQLDKNNNKDEQGEGQGQEREREHDQHHDQAEEQVGQEEEPPAPPDDQAEPPQDATHNQEDPTDSDHSKGQQNAPKSAPLEQNTECGCRHEGFLIADERFDLNVDQLFSLIFTRSKFMRDYMLRRGMMDTTVSKWRRRSNQQAQELSSPPSSDRSNSSSTLSSRESFSLAAGASDDQVRGPSRHKRQSSLDSLRLLEQQVKQIRSKQERQLSYSMNVNHVLAKQVQVEEVQKISLVKEGVYVLKSQTINSGVPCSESFTVDLTYCLTRPSGANESRLLVHGMVNFIKEKQNWRLAMVKSVIEKSSMQGVNDFISDLISSIKEYIETKRSDGQSRRTSQQKMHTRDESIAQADGQEEDSQPSEASPDQASSQANRKLARVKSKLKERKLRNMYKYYIQTAQLDKEDDEEENDRDHSISTGHHQQQQQQHKRRSGSHRCRHAKLHHGKSPTTNEEPRKVSLVGHQSGNELNQGDGQGSCLSSLSACSSSSRSSSSSSPSSSLYHINADDDSMIMMLTTTADEDPDRLRGSAETNRRFSHKMQPRARKSFSDLENGQDNWLDSSNLDSSDSDQSREPLSRPLRRNGSDTSQATLNNGNFDTTGSELRDAAFVGGARKSQTRQKVRSNRSRQMHHRHHRESNLRLYTRHQTEGAASATARHHDTLTSKDAAGSRQTLYSGAGGSGGHNGWGAAKLDQTAIHRTIGSLVDSFRLQQSHLVPMTISGLLLLLALMVLMNAFILRRLERIESSLLAAVDNCASYPSTASTTPGQLDGS